MSQHQPMHTAPKDGRTIVLAIHDHLDGGITEMRTFWLPRHNKWHDVWKHWELVGWREETKADVELALSKLPDRQPTCESEV